MSSSSFSRRVSFIFALALALFACGSPGPVTPQREAVVVAGTPSSVPVVTAPPEGASTFASEDDAPVPVHADDPTWGSRTALVTIVVFSDFQCPFCARLEGTFDRLRETYGEDKLRIVWKDNPLPFHKHARFAAEVGQAVFKTRGAAAFWRFEEMAFRRQRLMAPDTIVAWASAAGASVRVDGDSVDGGRWAKKIDADIELAKKIGASGTPASFVNGVRLSGAQPFEKFQELVDLELKRAEDLASRGVARDQVYQRLAATNFEKHEDADDDDDDKKEDKTAFKVPVDKSPVRGPKHALVTIVEFADFQCPYCKRVDATLERVRREYGDKVRLVWKDQPLPFHKRAEPAALLAREIRAKKGDAAFWDAHDALFGAQDLEDPELGRVATAAGLDAKKTLAALKSKALRAGLDDDLDLAEELHASGTPHFFINGRRLVGAQPFDKFKSVIDEELMKASAVSRTGVALSDIYDKLQATASGPVPLETNLLVGAPPANAPTRGAPGAKVVIQSFSDFQCPFCKRVDPALQEVLKTYAGQVKHVWRDLPLPMHQDAKLAAQAAREAFAQRGSAGFFKMHDMLFEHQNDNDGLKLDALRGYAKKIGLDLKRFDAALSKETHAAAIDKDTKTAHDASISGTPAFVINGYAISGAGNASRFRRVIRAALADVKAGRKVPLSAVGTVGAAAGKLVSKDTRIGTGATASKGDKLQVHYVGKLTDGTVFDTSRTRGQPFEFELGAGHVIKGWDSGLVGMKVGGTRVLTIPPDMGYGDRGAPPKIPPKATLVFEVELLGIK
jgi:protein-disulfide isomerase